MFAVKSEFTSYDPLGLDTAITVALGIKSKEKNAIYIYYKQIFKWKFVYTNLVLSLTIKPALATDIVCCSIAWRQENRQKGTNLTLQTVI